MVTDPLTGLLNIDKPLHMTSHDVVNRVRRITGVRRVGHAGTLDPLATGVLILAVGRATRFLEYIVGQPKTYEALVRLGQTTTTYDAEGEVTSEQPVTCTETDVVAALTGFRGDIEQVPPMYAALKRDGKPLYKLAREGVEVDRPPRPVTIYALDLLHWTKPDLGLSVTCSAGTYIRSLAHDLGLALGCGGYLAGLQRTAVGDFTVETAITLEKLTSDNWTAQLLPPEYAVRHLPRLDLGAEAAGKLAYGQVIAWEAGHPDAELVRIYGPGGEFGGLVVRKGDHWRPRKMWT